VGATPALPLQASRPTRAAPCVRCHTSLQCCTRSARGQPRAPPQPTAAPARSPLPQQQVVHDHVGVVPERVGGQEDLAPTAAQRAQDLAQQRVLRRSRARGGGARSSLPLPTRSVRSTLRSSGPCSAAGGWDGGSQRAASQVQHLHAPAPCQAWASAGEGSKGDLGCACRCKLSAPYMARCCCW